ncbi:hypothetical protein J6590_078637 [Homalodisca vitripennis]|nr:hypothetical protein J6590_078637 [Homalodisca vitripennis]
MLQGTVIKDSRTHLDITEVTTEGCDCIFLTDIRSCHQSAVKVLSTVSSPDSCVSSPVSSVSIVISQQGKYSHRIAVYHHQSAVCVSSPVSSVSIVISQQCKYSHRIAVYHHHCVSSPVSSVSIVISQQCKYSHRIAVYHHQSAVSVSIVTSQQCKYHDDTTYNTEAGQYLHTSALLSISTARSELLHQNCHQIIVPAAAVCCISRRGCNRCISTAKSQSTQRPPSHTSSSSCGSITLDLRSESETESWPQHLGSYCGPMYRLEGEGSDPLLGVAVSERSERGQPGRWRLRTETANIAHKISVPPPRALQRVYHSTIFLC